MLDSHVDHQDHSSVRSLAVLGLDECQRKDVADNQSWVAAHSTAGSSHYFSPEEEEGAWLLLCVGSY